MARSSTRSLTIQWLGDITYSQSFSAATNAASPAQTDITDLASGANTITVPTGGASAPTAVTIIPPAGNSTLMTLKGVTGDTGVALHPLDPTTIALKSTVTTLCVTCGGAIAGVRFIWS